VRQVAIVGALFAIAAVAMTTGCGAPEANTATPSKSWPDRAPPSPAPVAATSAERMQSPPQTATTALIDDDGKTLWESPTHGPPLSLAYLPPGCQIILALRPAALAGDPQGEKVIDWVSKAAPAEAQYLDGLLPRAPGLTQCLVGAQIRNGHWEFAVVANIRGATAAEYLASAFPNATKKNLDSKEYWLVDNRAYYLPAGADDKLLVVSSEAAIADIIDLAGSTPPLRRDIERLLAHTDASRHVTILFAPSFLFGEGASLFSGEAAGLRDPLFWFLGDNLSAAALSLHWDENFFIELTVVPTLDTPTSKVANQLVGRLSKSPELIEKSASAISPSEYSRALVARFPDMLRTLAAYTRHIADRDYVVLRSYLPASAGQNLLMGAELTLAETKQTPSAPTSSTAEAASKTIGERLHRRTSLRFTKDTLQAALKMLADDVGVEIIIRGPDLQLDGITKNQSFGIDVADKPAEEILVQILRLANPDKSAASPSDPKQKLVYVVEPKTPGGPDVVFVTTRAAAAKRGEAIPAVFIAK
jgi:hypothetical protein